MGGQPAKACPLFQSHQLKEQNHEQKNLTTGMPPPAGTKNQTAVFTSNTAHPPLPVRWVALHLPVRKGSTAACLLRQTAKGTPAQQWKHCMQQVFDNGPCSDCLKFAAWVFHICIIVGVQGLRSRGGVQGLEVYSLGARLRKKHSNPKIGQSCSQSPAFMLCTLYT